MATQVSTEKYIDFKLEEMLEKLKPRARHASQMHIGEQNQSIYKEIINGDIQISKQKKAVERRQVKNQVEVALRKKLLRQAERQKEELELKLGYLTNSINLMKKYQERRTSPGTATAMKQSYKTESSKAKQQQFKRNKKIWKDQIEQQKKKQEEKRKREEEQLKQSMLKLNHEKNENKKKEIIEHMKEIEERMKKRDLDIKEGNQRYQRVKREKSMYEKMNESYHEKQISFLEEQKKKLAEIRNFRKPIDQNQLKEHENKFFQFKKQRQEKRSKQRKMNYSRDDKPLYESRFYKRIVQSQRNEEQNQCVIKYKKMKQFSSHVKEHFVPEVDEKKRQEILDYIEHEKRKSQEKQEKQKELVEKPQKLGLQYLSELRNIPKKKKDQSRIQPPKTQRIRYQNYLTHHSESPNKKQPWYKILNSDTDKEEKAIRIQIQSQKKMIQLKRKQQQSRLLKQGDSGDIDDEYFSMIKAKLDFLTQK